MTELQKKHNQANNEKPLNSIGLWSKFLNTLNAISNLLTSLTPWLWAIVVVVVIIPLIGQIFLGQIEGAASDKSDSTKTIVIRPISTDGINDDIKIALKKAEEDSYSYASRELDVWVNDLMDRVDPNFLDWYFGYFNQKQIEYKSFFAGITSNFIHWLNPNSKSPEEQIAEKITSDFQTEFAKRVLRPQISQL